MARDFSDPEHRRAGHDHVSPWPYPKRSQPRAVETYRSTPPPPQYCLRQDSLERQGVQPPTSIDRCLPVYLYLCCVSPGFSTNKVSLRLTFVPPCMSAIQGVRVDHLNRCFATEEYDSAARHHIFQHRHDDLRSSNGRSGASDRPGSQVLIFRTRH